MNLKITSLVNVKVRIDRGFRRVAETDNMGSINPVNFCEKCRVKIYAELLRWHVPHASGLNFGTLRHGYLE